VVKRIAQLMMVGLVVAACSDTSTPSGPTRLAPYLEPTGDLTTSTVPNEYIVVLHDNVSDVSGASVASGAEVLARWDKALNGYAVRATPEQLGLIRSDARTKYVEPNGRVSKTITQNNPPSWGLDRIDQTNLPLSNSYTYANEGTGVHSYTIDTGIRGTHVEFTGRMGNGFTSINDGRGTDDCDGHGTHVTGTIGGTNYGVAKKVTLHPVRVLDCTGSGTWTQVINGINWVANNRILPAVANMSLGGLANTGVNTATANLVAAGVFVAVSSGNSSANACSYSPASTPEAMTVNASQINDARASFSNFGTCTDIFAPGVNIVSAYNTNNTATNTLSGTSMSSPHVAGAGALYLSANPTATPAQVAAALINNASNNKITSPGTGSPNKLLNISFIGGGPVNQAPVADFTISCQNSTAPSSCTVNAAPSTDDGGFSNLSFGWANTGGRGAASGATTTYNFSSTLANTFNVTLTATDAGGLTNAITKSVTIPPVGGGNQAPVAAITVNCVVASPKNYCLLSAANSTDDGGFANLSFRWTNTGGRSVKTGSTAKYNSVPGRNTFNVTLTATDAFGLTGTQTVSITIP
jgi:subtilisin family serine protease